MTATAWARAALAAMAALLWGPEGHAATEAERVQVRELLRAGEFAGAEAVLSTLDPDPELDVLWGLVHLGAARPDSAIARFERVTARDPERHAAWLYLGQAHFSAGQPAAARRALDRGADLGQTLPGYFAIRARVELADAAAADAVATLDFGTSVFPEAPELWRDRALTYLELGLAESAVTAAEEYRDRFPTHRTAWLILGSSLVESRRLERAGAVLEEARLRFVADGEVTRMLAQTYARREWHRAAAELFASIGERGAYEAADQFRLAGRIREALRWNDAVPDEKRRLDQRIALLVEGGRFDSAMALFRSRRDTVAFSDAIVHHLTYAAVRTGHTEDARRLATRLEKTDPAAARALRDAVDVTR